MPARRRKGSPADVPSPQGGDTVDGDFNGAPELAGVEASAQWEASDVLDAMEGLESGDDEGLATWEAEVAARREVLLERMTEAQSVGLGELFETTALLTGPEDEGAPLVLDLAELESRVTRLDAALAALEDALAAAEGTAQPRVVEVAVVEVQAISPAVTEIDLAAAAMDEAGGAAAGAETTRAAAAPGGASEERAAQREEAQRTRSERGGGRALRPLAEQVLVVTGASSGIGLATARRAAAHGAAVVLAARNEAALRQIAREIEEDGGRAAVAVADVGSEAAVRGIAEVARARFGRVDTWVNNAGVSIYGELQEVAEEDHRRLFETNFWGVVHGSRVAVEELERGGGGVLVNVGSILSEQGFPLQGMYVASKHAVKGFTDSLRIELEAADSPVRVCLVEPATIDTPYTRHARSYLGNEPRNPGPAYAPDVVARAILDCAEHPRPRVIVGGAGRLVVALGRLFPRLTDHLLARVVPARAHAGPEEPPGRSDALYEAGDGGRERGDHDGVVLRHSASDVAARHPWALGLVLAAGALWLARARAGAGTARPDA